MSRSNIEKCSGCDQPCRPVVYIGNFRIPVCPQCYELITDETEEGDIEWNENISREDFKVKIVLIKSIKKHDKVLRALARGGKKSAKRNPQKRKKK